MKYTREERLTIGQQIYDGELTKHMAAEQYGISIDSARDYMRLYRDENHLPSKNAKGARAPKRTTAVQSGPLNLEDMKSMTQEELILELVKARIAEARLKKGYEVKGDGTVIRYVSKNTK
jgi:transposase